MTARGPIQLSPPGLLGLLQLKADGRSVPLLDDTCQPSLEMAPWWLRAAAQLWPSGSTIAIGAGASRVFTPFTVNPFTVPDGQWYYIHDYTLAIGTSPTDTVTRATLSWASQISGSAYFAMFPDAPPFDLAASQERLVTARDFWLPPGARLGLWVDTVTGAAFSASVRQIRYTPCRG